MTLNLYLLEVDSKLVNYDCYSAQIVAAATEQEAREMCYLGDEGSYLIQELTGFCGYVSRRDSKTPETNPWLNQDWCDVTMLGRTAVYQDPCVVLSSFHAG